MQKRPTNRQTKDKQQKKETDTRKKTIEKRPTKCKRDLHNAKETYSKTHKRKTHRKETYRTHQTDIFTDTQDKGP